ncbi:RING finger protein 145 [Exaiptasia diaphana]|nr:RING finger protein 145 [Exaiptasia diaphana]
MDVKTALMKCKTSLGRFVNVLARIPFFYFLEIVYNFTSKSDNSTFLGAVGYAVGLIGLFTELDLLLSFYGWLIQVVIAFIMYTLVHEVKGTSQLANDQAEPSPGYFQLFVSDNHFYGQVIAATGLTVAAQEQWTELNPVWIITLMLTIPFGVALTFKSIHITSLLAPYICYIFLFIYASYLSYKGLKLAAKFLKSTKEASDNFWRMVDGYGWIPVFQFHWRRLELSRVIMFLWWIKFGLRVSQQKELNWFLTFASFGDTCAVLPNLFAASMVISEISFSILLFIQNSLQGNHVDFSEPYLFPGFNEGLAFFLLNIQIGINNGGTEHRSLVVSLVLFVTLSLLVQDVLEITEPVLAVLGATYTGKMNSKHVKVFIVVVSLFIVPGSLIYVLCSTFSPGTWLFIILSNSVVTMVQLAGSLSIFLIFIANVHFSFGWRDLDDCVYYVNAISKVFEFLVAVVVVFYSVVSALAGNWSVIGKLKLQH